MFEMLFKKLIHHSHLLHIFWQDIFDFMVDMDPHHGYVPNFDNTWKVDFNEDKYVDDEEIYEDFESVDDLQLQTSFGAICDDDFINKEETYGKKEKEKELFDEEDKEEIAKIISAQEDEEFVTQKEVSWVVEGRKWICWWNWNCDWKLWYY